MYYVSLYGLLLSLIAFLLYAAHYLCHLVPCTFSVVQTSPYHIRAGGEGLDYLEGLYINSVWRCLIDPQQAHGDKTYGLFALQCLKSLSWTAVPLSSFLSIVSLPITIQYMQLAPVSGCRLSALLLLHQFVSLYVRVCVYPLLQISFRLCLHFHHYFMHTLEFCFFF